VSGITWKILAPAMAIMAAIGGTALTLAVTTPGRAILTHLGFKTYQFNRIDAWLHPFDNTASTSLQLSQSLKAIGSGQLFGKGFNQIQVNVPVRESDMIFSVIGENFG
ncbi:FtsW/RodA/SpoVE family cell cycle protein, partial [Klebsiella pneumoniae]